MYRSFIPAPHLRRHQVTNHEFLGQRHKSLWERKTESSFYSGGKSETVTDIYGHSGVTVQENVSVRITPKATCISLQAPPEEKEAYLEALERVQTWSRQNPAFNFSSFEPIIISIQRCVSFAVVCLFVNCQRGRL
jgi:activator of HSP90 ATPase